MDWVSIQTIRIAWVFSVSSFPGYIWEDCDREMTTAIHNLYSEDAERAIIGACLVDPENINETALQPDDFYVSKHRVLWATIRSLAASGVMPDYVTVTESLDRVGKLDQVGIPYLTQVIQDGTFSSMVPGYTRIVGDYAARRRIIRQSQELAKIALDLETPITQKLPDIVDELTEGAKPRRGAAHWGSDLSNYYDWLEERMNNPADVWGISTGFKDFDKMTGGYQAGDLIYCAGKPGVGKSIFTIQQAVNMAYAGIPGAVYSLEMQTRQVIGRVVSGMSNVDSYTMKRGRMTAEQLQKVIGSIEGATRAPLYISDDAMLSSISLRADLARLKARHGIKFCVLDYDMLLNETNDATMNEIQFTTLVSKRMKAIAKDLNIVMITVSSVTKDHTGDDDKAPSLAGLRGSSQKLHNADIAFFLTPHIPNKSTYEKYEDNLRTITFVKGREMESLGSFHIVKLPNLPWFGDVERIKL